MTTSIALPLFDVLRSSASSAAGGAGVSEQFAAIAAEFVAAALTDYQHIQKLDKIPNGQPLTFDRQVSILIRHMYDEWATQAEGLLKRLEVMTPTEGAEASQVPGVDELRIAVARTRFMLSVSLEELEAADSEIEQGEWRSVEEVRRELRAAAQR